MTLNNECNIKAAYRCSMCVPENHVRYLILFFCFLFFTLYHGDLQAQLAQNYDLCHQMYIKMLRADSTVYFFVTHGGQEIICWRLKGLV